MKGFLDWIFMPDIKSKKKNQECISSYFVTYKISHFKKWLQMNLQIRHIPSILANCWFILNSCISFIQLSNECPIRIYKFFFRTAKVDKVKDQISGLWIFAPKLKWDIHCTMTLKWNEIEIVIFIHCDFSKYSEKLRKI